MNIDKNDLILTMLKDMRHMLERHVDNTEEKFKEVKQEIVSVRKEMKEEFASVRQEMKEEFANVRQEMKDEFAGVREEMKQGFVEAEQDRQSMKIDTNTIRKRNFSWNSRLMAFVITAILTLNTLISFIVAKLVVGGVKLAEVGGDTIIG